MSKGTTRVTIVGGGVAALEAMIALRRLGEERVTIELVTPTPEWAYRPLVVAEPFGLGSATRYDLVRIARDHGAALHLAGVEAIAPQQRRLRTWDGRTFDYELLLIAIGAQPATSLPGSVTVQGPGYTGRFRTILRELEERRIRRVAFAVPTGASWPLPLYELALMTAARVAERGLRRVELSIVTPEEQPLELFGPAASQAMRALLADRGVHLHTARHAASVHEGALALVPGGSVDADRVVSLPRVRGPFLSGLPHDPEGFIPTDLHGLVDGQRDVYAAGDATTFPIKQGGVATQQADAAAETIAARAGADVEPTPFRPVLRGMLLTGSTSRYLRADVSGTAGDSSSTSEQALWWPPSKIAGRWLAPYLALNSKELKAPQGVAVDADLTAIKWRAMIGRDREGRAALVRGGPAA
ncbi:MAG TPA: FAD/NAD(P)-binding oxidoreductase [Thermoleophilaceae bacterium]|jgi:sulfide:quinone oxidoreductase|nr:FAD/NAD(P)-binding oxidoreductase [Thermoleophilaceae bacterium]